MATSKHATTGPNTQLINEYSLKVQKKTRGQDMRPTTPTNPFEKTSTPINHFDIKKKKDSNKRNFTQQNGDVDDMSSDYAKGPAQPTDTELQSLDHKAQIGECFRNMFTRDIHTDVTIIVEDKVMNAHKAILITHSQYFKKCLIDSDPHAEMEIRVQGIRYSIFKLILQFMYTSELSLSITILGDLHYATQQLKIPAIFEKCETLLKTVNVSDALTILLNSYRKDSDICRYAFDLVVGSFHKVLESPRIVKQDLDIFLSFISSDELVVDTEMDVFRVALAYISYDNKRSENCSKRIMSYIRYNYMTPRDLLDCSILLPELKPTLLKTMWHAVSLMNKRANRMPLIDLPNKRQYRIDLVRALELEIKSHIDEELHDELQNVVD